MTGTRTGSKNKTAADSSESSASEAPVSQASLQEMTNSLREAFLEVGNNISTGLQETLTSSIQGSMQQAIREMTGVLAERLPPVSPAIGDQYMQPGSQGFITRAVASSSNNSAGPNGDTPGRRFREAPEASRPPNHVPNHAPNYPGGWVENPLFFAPQGGFYPPGPGGQFPYQQVPALMNRDQVVEIIQEQLGPNMQVYGRPSYRKPYNEAIDRVELPRGYKIPDFALFSGENTQSSVEHIARFSVQCGEAGANEFLKMRLFPNSLTGTAFNWYISLPPNSVQGWVQMEDLFHKQFYRTEPEVTLADLSRLSQMPGESAEDYVGRFKVARFKCKCVLPEVEYVRLCQNGLCMDLKKQYVDANFRDLYEMAAKVSRYEQLCAEERDVKNASKGTYYRDPNYHVAAADSGLPVKEVSVAEILYRKPYVCKAFVKVEPTMAQGSMATSKPSRTYTFDITRAEEVFDALMADRMFRFALGHKIPPAEEIKGKDYCKYHNSWNHTTNNCITFRNDVQDRIDKGEFKFPDIKKAMGVDADPFPSNLAANVVSVDMRGAPRTHPKQKISLGAPSRNIQVAGKTRVVPKDSSEREEIWWDQEVIRSKKTSSPSQQACCKECGHDLKTPKVKSIVVKSPRGEDRIAHMPKPNPPRRISVFDRIRPPMAEVQEKMRSLKIVVPEGGRRRTVKPPVPLFPDQWQKVKHPKFPQPEPAASRSQKRRMQRKRQAQRMAMEVTPSQEEAGIPSRTSPAKKRTKMEYRPVQKAEGSTPIPKTILPRHVALENERIAAGGKQKVVVRELFPAKATQTGKPSGGKTAGNSGGKATSPKLACNMVFVLPENFMAKAGQPSSMKGDVEVVGETPTILKEIPKTEETQGAFPEEVAKSVPSVVVLKEEPGTDGKQVPPSVLFERPDLQMTQHIRPLYITGHVDGVPVSRLLVDNGSAANLMPKTMLQKLGKQEKDLLPSSASISDFAGGVTTAQGIIIVNLTVGKKTLTTPFFVINSRSSYNLLLGRDWIHACLAVPSSLHQCLIFWNEDDVEVVWADRRPFLASSNHAEARLYDEEICPVKITGTDKYGRPKAISLSSKTSIEDLKEVYSQLVGPMITEVNRPITPIIKALTNGSDALNA